MELPSANITSTIEGCPSWPSGTQLQLKGHGVRQLMATAGRIRCGKTQEIPHVFWNYITWFNIHAPVQQYRLLGHSWCYKEIWQYSKGCLHDLGSTIVTSICISLVQYSRSSLWNMKPSSYICMLDPCDQTPRRFIRPIFMLLPRSLKTEAHEKNWAGAPEGWKVKVPHL